MRHGITFCKNCGIEYIWQCSGEYNLKTPKEFNDRDYCPECKEAIINALNKVIKKTELRYVPCNDFTLSELIQKTEEINKEKIKNINTNNFYQFPIMRRVFPKLYNPENDESTHTQEITINNTNYIYSYYLKTKTSFRLVKQVRWDLIKNEIYKSN